MKFTYWAIRYEIPGYSQELTRLLSADDALMILRELMANPEVVYAKMEPTHFTVAIPKYPHDEN